MASLYIERKYILILEIYMLNKTLSIFIFLIGYDSGGIKHG